MASVNKVIILGNLGRDPETRYMPDGTALCNLSLATTYGWKDKNSGERKEETEWHRVTLRGRLAEVAGQYLKKGSPAYVEGRLRTLKWQDKEGQDRYTTEIVGETLQLLGSRGGGGPGGEPMDDPEPRASSASRGSRGAPAPASAPSKDPFGDMGDDIPF
jgi:single-strand DNA-binding protein